jgi:hypothetical protein
MADKSTEKEAAKFLCVVCHYCSSRQSNYMKHLLTAKHRRLTQILTNTDENARNEAKNAAASNANKYECSCGKKYSQRQSLFTHKKTCVFLQKGDLDEETAVIVEDSNKLGVNTGVILDIIKENQEFKTLLVDQQKQVMELQKENNILMNKMVEISQNSLTVPRTINGNNNNNNTTNNQFNLNFFLNETCKNAINFTEFIDNIQITNNDLENNARMGFVEGVTKIIMDNLKQLELNNRPIHCTDVKRETIYVKEEDEWDKDNSKKVIQKGIQEITCKNMCQLFEWRENNPEHTDIDSELGEKSIVMQQNSMAGCHREEFYPKIIKNIAKETILDKKRLIE